MTSEKARQTLLQLLSARGVATNRQMIKALQGDKEMFEDIREELILEGIASDKDGVGLLFTRPWVESPSLPAAPTTDPLKKTGEAKGNLRPRLFLSYGRRDAKTLADRLVQDLETLGYEVWQDTRFLHAGSGFMAAIQDGLRATQVLIAVLSPHAVRVARDPSNPDGLDSVCLDEISFARFACKIPIVPIMGVTCEPPLPIFTLDYVDLVAWEQSEDQYQAGLKRLQEGIEGALRMEPPRFRKWVHRLHPWDFAPFLAEKRQGFSGREWLFEEIDRWRQSNQEPALLITGDPGVGKSAIVAELVHRNPGGQVLAYHCCQADTPATLQPGWFVRSLAGMIASRLDSYAVLLDHPTIDKVLEETASDADPATALEAGILIPLQSLPAPEQGIRYLLIDALDEALLFQGNASGAKNIIDVLASRMRRLPPWLRIVVTTRRESTVMTALKRGNMRTKELNATDPRNRSDITQYIRARLQVTPLAEEVAKSGLASGAVAEVLQRKSDGNFLYVKQALDALQVGDYTLVQLFNLPPGLEGLYQDFFARHFPALNNPTPTESPDQGATRRLLEVVVAAQEPLSLKQLTRALGEDDCDQTSHLLSRLTVYLPMRDGLVRVFHKSFADWLAKPGHNYHVKARLGHASLAEACWQVHLGISGACPSAGADSRPFQSYAFRHGIRHLLEAGAYARAVELLYCLMEKPHLEGHPGEAYLLTLARFLARSLPDCPASQATQLAPRKLASILTHIPSFEPLLGGLRLLSKHHPEEWKAILTEFKGTVHCWVLVYACSFVMAETYLEKPDQTALAEIHALIRGSDIAFQEMGAYAVKMICMHRPDLIDNHLLEEMAAGDSCLLLGILGELALYLTFNGLDPHKLSLSFHFWSPLWDYNRILVDDIVAAEFIARREQALPADLPETARESHRQLGETERNRLELLASEEVQREPTLKALLEAYYRLPTQLEKVRLAEEAVARAMNLKPLLKVLLSSPYWEVREAAGSLAMSLAETRPEVKDLLQDLLRDDNWRCRYAALELAAGLCHQDNSATLLEALEQLSGSPHPWLRGMCSDCLATWVLGSETEKPATRMRRVSKVIESLFIDEEPWTLEEMHRLFKQLHAEGEDIRGFLPSEISPLLRGHPLWYELERSEFRQLLETEKKKKMADREAKLSEVTS